MHKSGLIELQALLAVARRRSFRAAAVELEMSTSALSSAIAGLEVRLGSRLFHRTTRSVALTDAGQQFVEQIAPAVKQIQDAMATVNDRRTTPTGTLRINSSLGAALMSYFPLMSEFSRRYPDVTLDLVTEGQMVDIIAEGFDAGLRPSHLVPKDMIRVPLSDDVPLCIVGSRDYFAQHPPPQKVADLSSHRCIRARLPNGAASPWQLLVRKKTIHVEVPGSQVFDAPLLMREGARRGLGLAQVAHWYVADDIAKGELMEVLPNFAPRLPGLSLYYAGNRHVPAGLRALIDLAHAQRTTKGPG
ncbi:LysR family transcriptional regulator [Variovorax sp. HJSM1_2]|uniref:LysR family transcriptional regulator n=1 Tax=Variovorax sp. HJSM1_2 TaxID=3366263 RepID=UPI003BDF4170